MHVCFVHLKLNVVCFIRCDISPCTNLQLPKSYYFFLCRAIMIGNVVQGRLPMVSQLMEGLAPCGILAAIQANPEVMRLIFCMSHTGEKLDEDRFINLLKVNFSQEQQKKAKETDAYKVFSDYVGMVAHEGK